MTRDKKAKKIARALKASGNLSYTSARRSTPSPHPTPSVEELVEPILQQTCDEFIDAPIGLLGDIEVTGPVSVSEATVHRLRVNAITIEAEVVEELEGRTLVCIVSAEASLIVEGLMAKDDASVSAENGLVEILDLYHDPDHALVAITAPQTVDMEFSATVTPDAESVDDVNFVGARQDAFPAAG